MVRRAGREVQSSGTENRPLSRMVYIDRKDKLGKWLLGTVGFAVLLAILSGIMAMILK